MKPALICALVACLLLQFAGLALFAKGMFPYKVILPGLASDEVDAPKVFDKLIFVVIDALRSDFVFSAQSNMTFLHQLIISGCALPLTAYSTPPTVTLPRLKGLTTGSVPNFLDAVLNIAESDTSSTLATQDSWLAQARRAGKRIHMFGDDTWIKLFPDFFAAADGTTSFFVSDFTEVDNNVTRHLDTELSPSAEWDFLVLHYLGLDHIGHKSGPQSVHMPAKQAEMDDILRRIYQYADSNPETLVVLCGDHGMNSVGNHGGSSEGETSAAMVFMSPLLQKLDTALEWPAAPISGQFQFYKTIDQSDLVPTISSLLGFPIPHNSLGHFIEELLPLWSNLEDQRAVLLSNANELARLMKSTFSGFSKSSKPGDMYCVYESLPTASFYTISRFISQCQSELSSVSSNYNMNYMLCGLIFAVIALGAAVYMYLSHVYTTFSRFDSLSFALFCVLFGAAMFGSSFVEEEHWIWYWIGSLLILCYIVQCAANGNTNDAVLLTIVLGIFRILRRWNQSGQKYAGSDDIAKYLAQDSAFLFTVNCATYGLFLLIVWRYIYFKNMPGMLDAASASIVTFTIFTFKVSMAIALGEEVPTIVVEVLEDLGLHAVQPTLVQLARYSYFFIAMTIVYALFMYKTQMGSLTELGKRQKQFDFVHGLVGITALGLSIQSRYSNIPVWGLFYILYSILYQVKGLSNSSKMIICLILGRSSFFAFGNSNSLSSIDLSNSYNGIDSYSVILVGLLTFIGTYAGPIFWSISVSSLGLTMDEEDAYIILSVLVHSTEAICVCLACFFLRSHLFIWTVFSPKLLYASVWEIIQQPFFDIGLVAVTWRIVSSI
ncbi:hypothetical protein CANCADRAFT_1398 [Tortispora caseinolytica NRRL Y-17796]|uniref:GPI ethanolamine phosphate transferase 2 n=1 Tax=Tortispora caseinolytica NRRL Y-17796 TaxID=767744 RepID=A0A1E4TM24_9ASCO|nr:hypothetical protein CANCADRAFT_1398 [Tortispora caseinolytica NRRL Y-17796]